MSLALSIAIHNSLIKGVYATDFNYAPYGGCWVPHSAILSLPECWVLSPETEYDVHTLPANMSRSAPFWLNPMGEIGGIYCTDGECASWFRIQRKEQ